MVGKTAFKEHKLGCIAGESASDQNITSPEQALVNIDDVDDAFLEVNTCKLLQKEGVLLFLVVSRLIAKRWQILAGTIAAYLHESRRDRTLQESEWIRAVGEEADSILFHVSDLP